MSGYDDYLEQLKAKLSKNLDKAGRHLRNEIRKELNRSQPYERTKGAKGIYYTGLDPSLPGEPPKKIRGDLQRSIAVDKPDPLTVKVGSNLDRAYWLEVGTHKMAARPFFRSTLAKEIENLARIITGG